MRLSTGTDARTALKTKASSTRGSTDDHHKDEPIESVSGRCNDSQNHGSPSANNDINRLLSLPTELLEIVLSNLGMNDRLSTKFTCRKLYNFSSISKQDLDKVECDRFVVVMRREGHEKAVAAEATGHFSLSRRPCSACRIVHPVAKFSKWQQVRLQSRQCLLSQRKLAVCEHKSYNLLDLKLMYQIKCEMLRQGLKVDEQQAYGDESSALASTENNCDVVCKHEDHLSKNARYGHSTLPSLVFKSGRGKEDKGSIQARAQFDFREGAFRTTEDFLYSDYPSLALGNPELMRIWLCPHMTVSNALRCSFRSGFIAYRGIVRICNAIDCTMSFWLELGTTARGKESGKRNDICLHVVHCDLDLSVAADHPSWLACSSVEPGNVSKMVARILSRVERHFNHKRRPSWRVLPGGMPACG
ncbi:hypothetical protein LTR56_000613 [Elasticomyces elasticus]|nr:hypothetical protein LTR56_000613 [Elasticomyces elasticus]KAK3664389.1 hypothetical protein LTR22_004802 [Elasticomyces elasticus]KAK4919392.1 hypothetical protein LTR49_012926 [Elasticomyces elasticus]KAK5758266.1 hypothetical protein LTS12_011589 [Elasticomyces elasticus]